MKFQSIRWRLPLSYAAIALITTLVLGGVMLWTLRQYYAEVERKDMQGDAEIVGAALSPLLAAEYPRDTLQAQVNNLALVTGMRIQVQDPQGGLIVDSGEPATQDVVSFAPVPRFEVDSKRLFLNEPITDTLWTQQSGFSIHMVEVSGPERVAGIALGLPEPPVLPGSRVDFSFPLSATVRGDAAHSTVLVTTFPANVQYGFFNLPLELESSGRRSSLILKRPVWEDGGKLIAEVVLSQGPAYGSVILESVAWAWAAAGLVAMLLAAGLGWWASRRVTQPVLALTEATRRMSSGDLSVRTNITLADEFGVLGSSFNRMAEQVEATILALRQFVSDAAHELQTPLTALRTNLELAAEDGDLQTQAGFIHQAQLQVERLYRLAQDLLDLSRLESGLEAHKREPLALGGLLESACEPFAARAEQGGIEFELAIAEDLPPVSANTLQLSRVVANLLDNALKFTPAGGRVQVSLSQKDGQVCLAVQDSGIGIPAEDMQQLFLRFHRGRNAAAYPGSGLGLAIVRAIVQAHGGEVRAETPAGGGACFEVCIPAEQGAIFLLAADSQRRPR